MEDEKKEGEIIFIGKMDKNKKEYYKNILGHEVKEYETINEYLESKKNEN